MSRRPPELPALTGLRFLAALAVIAVHLRGHFAALLPGMAPLDPGIRAGHLGVELFFVLSGFILGYHYLEALARPSTAASRAFLRRRLARIYPMHVLTLALFALLIAGLSALGRPMDGMERFGLGDLFANVALVHCWTLTDCGWSWNGPAWSLSAEWFAYLAFPLLAAAVARVRRRGALLAAIAAVVLAQLWGSEVAGLDGGIGRVAATFTLGVLLARLHRDGVPGLDWGAVATWALVATPLLAGALSTAGASPSLVVPLFGLIVLALANAPEARVSRLLGGGRMRFWGQASYALYLTHALVLAVAAPFVRLELVAQAGLGVRVGLIAGLVVTMLLVAAVAFRGFEEPYRALVARGSRASAARPAAPVRRPVAGAPQQAPPALAPVPQPMAQSAPTS